jgi:hypothetical protein
MERAALKFALNNVAHLHMIDEASAYASVLAAIDSFVARGGSIIKTQNGRVRTVQRPDDVCSVVVLLAYGGGNPACVWVLESALAERCYARLLTTKPLPVFLERALEAAFRMPFANPPTLVHRLADEARVWRYLAAFVDVAIVQRAERAAPRYDSSVKPLDNARSNTVRANGRLLSMESAISYPNNDSSVCARIVTRFFCEYLVAETLRVGEKLVLPTDGSGQRLYERALIHAAFLRSGAEPQPEQALTPRELLAAHLLNAMRVTKMLGYGDEARRDYFTAMARMMPRLGVEATTARDRAMALELVRTFALAPHLLRLYHVSLVRRTRDTQFAPVTITTDAERALAFAAEHKLVAQAGAMRSLMASASAQYATLEYVGECEAADIVRTVQATADDMAEGRDFVLGWSETDPSRCLVLVARDVLDAMLAGVSALAPALAPNAPTLDPIVRAIEARRTNWQAASLALAAARTVFGLSRATRRFDDEASTNAAVARLDRIVALMAPSGTVAALAMVAYRMLVGRGEPLFGIFELALTARAPTVLLVMPAHATATTVPSHYAHFDGPYRSCFEQPTPRERTRIEQRALAEAAAIDAPVLSHVHSAPSDDEDDEEMPTQPSSKHQRSSRRRRVVGLALVGAPSAASALVAPTTVLRHGRDAVVRAVSSKLVHLFKEQLHLRLADEIIERAGKAAGPTLMDIRICPTLPATTGAVRLPAPFVPPATRRPPPPAPPAKPVPAPAIVPSFGNFLRVWAAVERVLANTPASDVVCQPTDTRLQRAQAYANEVLAAPPSVDEQPFLCIERARLSLRAHVDRLVSESCPQFARPLFFAREHLIEGALVNTFYVASGNN